MRRSRSVYTCALPLALTALIVFSPSPAAAQSTQPSFKLAFFNIQSGKGEPGLPGHATPFADTANCTDPTLPMNAWGLGAVQRVLADEIGSDPSILALGLAESWTGVCGSPENVRQALGWKARSEAKNGLAIVARHGFAGPVTFIQLDTSLSTDLEPRYIGHAQVCLDPGCTATSDVFVTHWNAGGSYKTDVFERQARQSVAFMQAQAAARPRTMLGDLNVYETSHSCASSPVAPRVLDQLRSAGYVDAWRAIYGAAEGYTGMTNRPGCGSPEGYTYKRIDYSWSLDQAAVSMKRFALSPPGEPAASDHYGIIVELPRAGAPAPDVTAPVVAVTSPAAGATINGVALVAAAASDEGGVARVEFLADGALLASDAAAPFEASWDTRPLANGTHSIQARAYDTAGNAASSPLQMVAVANVILPPTPPPSPASIAEVVLHAASASAVGAWQLVDDTTAADGTRLWNKNAGAARVAAALAAPASYAELTFDADGDTAYRIWIRGKADADSWANDSVYVQFSDSVDAAGAPIWRIGTASSTTYQAEDGTNAGLKAWGWQDNGYGVGVLGATVRFAAGGEHTIRIQTREDGLSIDQIVLSAAKYLATPPGLTKNDATIVEIPVPPVSLAEVVLSVQTARVVGGWTLGADATAAAGTLLRMPDAARARVGAAVAAPASYAELTFRADAGREYHLWMRGRADRDSWANDSVYVQFSDSVDAGGAPIWRIGTTSATTYQLEDGVSAGLKGWGWQDNGYGTLGTCVRFAETGTHTIRIQNREDGLAIDQIVLSSGMYVAASPGATKNDTTILVR